MHITIIGVGKLGLCLALNLERYNHTITCLDINKSYIDSLNDKTYKTSEPYVDEYLKSSKNITFTTDYEQALKNDIIFIVVNTPSTNDHKYNHTNIENVISKFISYGKQKTTKELIINCTTFPGYCFDLYERVKLYNYNITYNPEFVSQGNIIYDQINCDFVLIGETNTKSGDIVQSIYSSFCKSKNFKRMSLTEAELTKLSINCFLTTKISYANMIGDIALKYNASPEKILDAIGTDSRIGNKYLKYGFGFGGPCFPRDNRALYKCASDVGIDAILSKCTDTMNEFHLDYQVQEFIKKHPNKSLPIDIYFVTYKKESTSIENSQQLKFTLKLKELGYKINLLEKRDEVLNQLKNIIL